MIRNKPLDPTVKFSHSFIMMILDKSSSNEFLIYLTAQSILPGSELIDPINSIWGTQYYF